MTMKGLAGADGQTERFRVVFSDSQNFIQTMLATRRCYHPGSGRN